MDYFKTYQIDLRGLEDGTLDPSFMSVLLDGLPSNCEVNKILYPDMALSITDWLLNAIEYQLRCIAYGFSSDAKMGRNKPEMLFKPDKKKEEDEDYAALSIDEIKNLAALYVQQGGE